MFTLNCKGRLLSIDKPVVMGILNCTPNSFYTASRRQNVEDAVQHGIRMVEAGATIIDIGGQSTRPGSKNVSAQEEADRVLPVIEHLMKAHESLIISIDTYYASVAKQAVETGASIVNDISGGNLDAAMLETVGSLNVPYICMHMKGTPDTMQNLAEYENITREVFDFFIKKIADCQKKGISDIILDPGFGFAKNIGHNFKLMAGLPAFKMLERPLLVGISRKATIYKTLNISAEEALNGTTVLNTIALINGANILRVHDVKEAMQAIELVSAYKEKSSA